MESGTTVTIADAFKYLAMDIKVPSLKVEEEKEDDDDDDEEDEPKLEPVDDPSLPKVINKVIYHFHSF